MLLVNAVVEDCKVVVVVTGIVVVNILVDVNQGIMEVLNGLVVCKFILRCREVSCGASVESNTVSVEASSLVDVAVEWYDGTSAYNVSVLATTFVVSTVGKLEVEKVVIAEERTANSGDVVADLIVFVMPSVRGLLSMSATGEVYELVINVESKIKSDVCCMKVVSVVKGLADALATVAKFNTFSCTMNLNIHI